MTLYGYGKILDVDLTTRKLEKKAWMASLQVLSREEVEHVLDEYYELRGWDKVNGLPTVTKLNSLGLQDLAADLQRLEKICNT
jgi:aldehyde:ferredoxin oxidoreductase